ncbi:MAG: septum formation initiator family protein [Acutalibacteraceae bacterium]
MSSKKLNYDFSMFEEKTERQKAVEKYKNNMTKNSEQPKKKRKHNFFLIFFAVIIGGLATSVVAFMISGQVKLTELNQQIIEAQQELDEAKSVYTQMQMRIDAKFTADFISNYAVTELNMVKSDDFQKTYIKLSEGDKVQILKRDEDSIIQSLVNAISDIWS